MNEYTISSLFIYPVKSCQGISIEEAKITAKGFLHDREYMLVNKEGKFITQRDFPKMAQIEVKLLDDGMLELHAPHMKPALLKEIEGNRITVTLWEDTFVSSLQDEKVSNWFSKFLGSACYLVKQTEIPRAVKKKYAIAEDNEVNLADAYPIHLATEASLNRLNEITSEKITIDRFRPNIILPGKFPFAEDFWGEIKIGHTEFVLVKACYRCAIPTIDQKKGIKGQEPLLALTGMRRNEKGVPFGQYIIPKTYGQVIRAGDTIEVLKQK